MSQDERALLIQRYLDGRCTPAEKQQLLNEFSQYGLTEEELPSRFFPSSKQSRKMHRNLVAELGFPMQQSAVHSMAVWSRRVAAVFIPAILLAGTLYLFLKQSPNTVDAVKAVYNTTAGIKRLQLTDGTTVWLNRGAVLQLDTAEFTNTRHVQLRGEAYFEVTADVQHPFIVTTGGMATKVLGTSFNIKTDTAAGNTMVTLVTGKVALLTANNPVRILQPGEAAVYNESNRLLDAVPVTPYTLAWKTSKLPCSKEPMSRIIDYLGAYYNMSFHISPTVAGRQFSGTLSLHDGLPKVLERLLFVHQLRYKQNGNSISIY